MAYKNLAKLYYGNKDIYTATYHQRFNSESSIKLDFDVAKHPAFLVQSSDVIDLLYEILTLDKSISDLRKRLPRKALRQYSRKCLIDEIVLTNNIEGVHSSRKEIGAALKILEEQSNKKDKKNIFLGLVNKYYKLLSGEAVALNTCEDIRDLYDEMVLDEVIYEDKGNAPDGKMFRKEIAEVYNSAGKAIHKGKYPETEIIIYLEKALNFLNNTSINPLYRICIFHYMLEYIHPFYDGNGRLGRFILSYCIAEHLESLLAFRISETIKENIKKYYDAFSLCNNPKNLADLTPFLIMMLEMIRDASLELKESLSRKLISWNRYQTLLPRLNDAHSEGQSALYDYLIRAALFSERGISTQELLSVLNTSYSTLGKRLKLIEDQNLLLCEKYGNRKYYMIDIHALDDMLLEGL